jgi:hypothetical protein
MRTSDEIVTKGVVEAPFSFEVDGATVPGILWRPAGTSGPTPVVLLGHGGTQDKRAMNILGLARRFVRHLGVSAVAIDAPGHGDRVVDAELAEAQRRDLERRVRAMRGEAAAPRPMPADDDAYAATHARAATEWSALLDLLEHDGLPMLAGEPRVRCAVLGLACLSGWPNEAVRAEAARRLEIPVLFVLQWDDQLMTRQSGLDLFDAIGSKDKVLHVFPGGHIDTPLSERDAYDAFFARHLAG